MKIGVTQIILGATSLTDTLALCEEAGYDAVELVFAEGKDLRVDMSLGELAEVAAVCRSAGVEIVSVMAQPKERGNLLSTDAGQRALCVARLRRSIEIAGALGVGTTLLHPGQLPIDAHYGAAWNYMRDALAETASFAADQGVAIGVENVWNKFLLSPLEAERFVDEVGSEWVGIYLDTANMMAYGYPEQWIRQLGVERIKGVHFKDYVRREHRFVNLLDGDTDWCGVMEALRDVGYNAWAIHEVGGSHEELVDLGGRMRQIVAM